MSTSRSKKSLRKHQGSLKTASLDAYRHASRLFVERDSFEAKERAFREIPKANITRSHVDISRMLFELSVIAPNRGTRDDYLVAAVERAHSAVQQAVDHKTKFEASVHQATLPLMALVHHHQEHADTSSTTRSMEQIAVAVSDFYACDPFSRRYNPKDNPLGLVAESTVMLALQSFVVHELGTEDTTVVPSLFSDDNTPHRTNVGQYSWDISVFERDDVITRDPTSKIQVKYTHKPKHDTEYHEDIDIVGLIPDLFSKGLNVQSESIRMAQACRGGAYDDISHDVNRLVDRIF